MLTIRLKAYPILAALFMLVFSSASHATLIDGKDWRQLTETTGLSFVDVTVTDCDAITGVCSSGSHNGWTIASQYDVAQMFKWITGANTWDLTDSASLNESNSSWASFAIDIDTDGADLGLFHANVVSQTSSYIQGATRTTCGLGCNWGAYIFDNHGSGSDIAGTNDDLPSLYVSDTYGVWMYATLDVSVSVPEPASLALLTLGLAGLSIFRRKRPRS